MPGICFSAAPTWPDRLPELRRLYGLALGGPIGMEMVPMDAETLASSVLLQDLLAEEPAWLGEMSKRMSTPKRTVSLHPEAIAKEAGCRALQASATVDAAIAEARRLGAARAQGLSIQPGDNYRPGGEIGHMGYIPKVVWRDLALALEAAFMRGLVEGQGR